MEVWSWAILLLINIYGFALMGIDKNKAKKGQFRISERALWLTAILGGAAGVTLGMNFFRHKTKHSSFRIGLPTILIIQLVLLYLVLK